MLKIGSLVRVLYPEYAAGILGRILDNEPSGRWIVQLEYNPIEDDEDPLLLSLEESEFEVIRSDPRDD
ncbi:MAG: hypothetical protein AB4352_00360 [Hormoscilla sp.]